MTRALYFMRRVVRIATASLWHPDGKLHPAGGEGDDFEWLILNFEWEEEEGAGVRDQ